MPYELLFTALTVGKCEKTSIYGLGVTLYTQESANSTFEMLPHQEDMKSIVRDIVKESASFVLSEFLTKKPPIGIDE